MGSESGMHGWVSSDQRQVKVTRSRAARHGDGARCGVAAADAVLATLSCGEGGRGVLAMTPLVLRLKHRGGTCPRRSHVWGRPMARRASVQWPRAECKPDTQDTA
jgi:hypothetical protein